jgi:hypothetical protein
MQWHRVFPILHFPLSLLNSSMRRPWAEFCLGPWPAAGGPVVLVGKPVPHVWGHISCCPSMAILRSGTVLSTRCTEWKLRRGASSFLVTGPFSWGFTQGAKEPCGQPCVPWEYLRPWFYSQPKRWDICNYFQIHIALINWKTVSVKCCVLPLCPLAWLNTFLLTV